MSTNIKNQAAADMIAKALPLGLPHPGDPGNHVPPGVIRLPGFNTAGMSAEQAQEFVGNFATLVAESVVNLLETEGGYEIVPKKAKKAAPKKVAAKKVAP